MIFRKIHATTTNPPTYFRLLLIILISVAATRLPIREQQGLFDFLSFNAVNVGLLFAIIAGFLMMITLNKKQLLSNYVSTELNKIRRMYHLAKNIAEITPAAELWFKEVDQALSHYFDLFRRKDFRSYEEGNELFRAVTYAIYRLPLSVKSYNSELYTALLQTAGEATEAREHIRSYKDSSIGFFQWASIIIVAVSFAIIIALAIPQDSGAMWIGGMVIFNLFLMIQLLYEYDRINKRKGKSIARVYLENERLMRIDVVASRKKTRSLKSASAA